MIRVLHVITRLTLGGSSENTVASVLALDRAGYTCALAAGLAESEAATVEDARRRGCRILDVPSLGREVAPLRDLTTLRDLRRLMLRERPHIVHTHTSKAGFVGRLAARLARVPAVIHQPHGHIFYGYYGPLRTALFVLLERVAARWTDRIITLTERGTEEHLARRIGRRERFVTVPSGVPVAGLRTSAPSRGAARARLGLPPAAFVIAGLGRLVPVKGFDLLVRALPAILTEVPGAHVVLIGDGPERGALEALATRLGVAHRLTLTGATREVAACLAGADVVAAPSRNEGMGRALVEAMALGIPVVGTAVGGIPGVIADGEAGRLVPPEDPAALARALASLGRDPALGRKLGEAGARRAEQFSTETAERSLLAAYASLVRDKRLA
ncbi:MAG: glycosyltransferase [Candidatus Rokubacteria bacterium]|nr:glycosyltransferase [Candidatus Rokubacteria bacterium]